MAIERRFVRKAIADYQVKQFIKKELERAGVSQVILQKTPMATRIILYVRRPGIVVGKRGSSIKDLCEKLTRLFGVENPQLDVIEVEKPALDAILMAEKVGKQIEVRGNVKQILRYSLKEIMEAGAQGAEIRIAGKVVGKGGKAKALKLSAGHLKKSGDLMSLVPEGRYICFLKAGTIGVRVKIVPPNVRFPDTYDYKDISAKLAALVPAEIPAPAAVETEGQAEDLEEKIEEKLAQAKEAALVEETADPEKTRQEKESEAGKPAKKPKKTAANPRKATAASKKEAAKNEGTVEINPGDSKAADSPAE